MLTLLKIRNLALVDELVWELGPGLVGVTGETGAGKSVIVGALKLVLGERADKSLIRTGEDSCTVEAVFDLRDASEINAVLAEGGLDACDDGSLIVRRVIGQSANRQFVNDSPVTLNLLKRLGEHLVDLHGPHDHQSLLSTERQLAMLDAYAGSDAALDAYRSAWRSWRDKVTELEDSLQRVIQDKALATDAVKWGIMEAEEQRLRGKITFFKEREGSLAEEQRRLATGVAQARMSANNTEFDNFMDKLIAKRNEEKAKFEIDERNKLQFEKLK
jgi:DNA repair protein RecN (Recombination protein N)